MKLRHESLGVAGLRRRLGLRLALVALVVLALASMAACIPRQKRTDWRSPAPRAACASDTDCPGSTCAIELGATQGTCSGAPLPALPDADGGARPSSHPPVNIQPSASDIKL